jgi:hypothetical protein
MPDRNQAGGKESLNKAGEIGEAFGNARADAPPFLAPGFFQALEPNEKEVTWVLAATPKVMRRIRARIVPGASDSF